MSVQIKVAHMKYKNSQGNYVSVNSVAERAASEQITSIQNAGAAAVSHVQQTVANSQAAVASLDTQRSSIIAEIASVAGQSTDDTLSQSGVAADAAAVGELKSAVNSLDHRSVAAEIHETISTPADIMTITDGADNIPVDELVVGIEPVQDLHGYEYPWPGGGGKNKFNVTATTQTVSGVTFTIDDGVVTITGTASETIGSFALGSVDLPAGSYKANGFANGASNGTRLVVYNITASSAIGAIYGGSEISFTLESASTIRLFPIIPAEQPGSGTTYKMYPMIRLASETDGTFAPYSNICPISGWTGANVTRTAGTNLLNPSTWSTGYINAYGVVTPDSGSHYSAIIPVEQGEYVFSGVAGKEAGNKRVHGYDSNGDWVQQLGVASNVSNRSPYNVAVTVPSGVAGIRVSCYVEDTNTKFEYGNAYSITFPSQAGTVYGGTLTVNQDGTGTLAVDKSMVESPTEGWTYNTTNHVFIKNLSGYSDGIPVCNMYSGATSADSNSSAYSKGNGMICVRYPTIDRIYIRDDRFTDASTFMSSITGLQISVSIPSVTYSLTADQVTTLIGKNNLWSDTGAIQSIAYSVNTKLYVDKKITQAVAAALNA